MPLFHMVAGAPDPVAPGLAQAVQVPADAERYIAVRAVDDQGNVGRIAQVDLGPGPPPGDADNTQSTTPCYAPSRCPSVTSPHPLDNQITCSILDGMRSAPAGRTGLGKRRSPPGWGRAAFPAPASPEDQAQRAGTRRQARPPLAKKGPLSFGQERGQAQRGG